MRLLILSFFFLLLGCNTYFKTEKIYICGDHPCKSTKEAKEYLDKTRVENIIRKYSDHISIPIIVQDGSEKKR